MNVLQLLLDQQRQQQGGQGAPLPGPLGDLPAPVQRGLFAERRNAYEESIGAR